MPVKCSLCVIAQAEPSTKPWALWHGDDVVSLKPFGAVVPMHRIFIPVQHIVYADEAPQITARCFEEAARWANGQERPFNLVVNSGKAAGQGTFHLHVHYVPREQGDGLGYRWKAGS